MNPVIHVLDKVHKMFEFHVFINYTTGILHHHWTGVKECKYKGCQEVEGVGLEVHKSPDLHLHRIHTIILTLYIPLSRQDTDFWK
jgi:hypothetical protein